MPSKRSAPRRKETGSSHQGADALSGSALRMIDQAASLLKKGVLQGAKHSAPARQKFKERALDLVTTATEQLNKAIEKGSDSLRKGIKKL